MKTFRLNPEPGRIRTIRTPNLGKRQGLRGRQMTTPTYSAPILSPYVDPDILTGKHGRLQVRALPDADTFGLFYLANPVEDRPELKRGWTLLACHPNGHSSKELANRILAAWEGTGDEARAVDQFNFILECGGLGRSLETILAVIGGQY